MAPAGQGACMRNQSLKRRACAGMIRCVPRTRSLFRVEGSTKSEVPWETSSRDHVWILEGRQSPERVGVSGNSASEQRSIRVPGALHPSLRQIHHLPKDELAGWTEDVAS